MAEYEIFRKNVGDTPLWLVNLVCSEEGYEYDSESNCLIGKMIVTDDTLKDVCKEEKIKWFKNDFPAFSKSAIEAIKKGGSNDERKEGC